MLKSASRSSGSKLREFTSDGLEIFCGITKGSFVKREKRMIGTTFEENEEGNKTIPGFLNWVIEAVGSVLVENVCLHLLLQLFMSDT